MANRFVGITVLGDYILSEGLENVLANLKRVGATAVATNPTVTAPAEEGTGSFQPPTDAGSSPRVFDRPLFGKTSLWVRGGPSYSPNAKFYQDSPYGPRKANDLTETHGAVIGEFIQAARSAGIQVFFQVGAAQPTGLRDEDRPQLPGGELPQNRVADTANLASKAVRAYNRAYVRDLVAAYPEITGFRPDWPEFPCYTLGECFQGFGRQTEVWAREHGYDYSAVRESVNDFSETLHGRVTNAQLERMRSDSFSEDSWPAGIRKWLKLKRELSLDLLADWRAILDEAGGTDLELSANAFMPDYTTLTGFDFADAAEICSAVSPKLYTMHWSQMVEFWGKPILENNPGLDERLLVDVLCGLMGIHTADEGNRRKFSLSDYGYPAPDEPHPISSEVQSQKIADVCGRAGGKAMVTPLVHGYGPLEDFERRLNLVADSPADGVWINRYGYLSDEKLAAISRINNPTRQ